jgi:DNA replication regulator DPB11
MVCNTPTPNKEKLRFAVAKQIPAVHCSWLWDCMSTGKLQPFDQYLIDGQPKAKQYNASTYAEVPTAPLSEEERRRRKEQLQYKPRGDTVPSAPLDLSLSANLTAAASVDEDPSEQSSDIHPDGNCTLKKTVDGAGSPALQILDPQVNTPRRPSTASHSSTRSKSGPTSRENSEAPAKPLPADVRRKAHSPADNAPEQPKTDRTAIMMELLARRKAVSATSGNAATTADDKRKRRKAQLGRATSTTGTGSNQSTAEASSGAQDGDAMVPEADDDDVDQDLNLAGEALTRGSKTARMLEEYQPSQSLLYEDPEVQAAREQMIRAMGGTVERAGAVVGPIGVVKDVVLDGVGGVAGRGPRKKRR